MDIDRNLYDALGCLKEAKFYLFCAYDKFGDLAHDSSYSREEQNEFKQIYDKLIDDYDDINKFYFALENKFNIII